MQNRHFVNDSIALLSTYAKDVLCRTKCHLERGHAYGRRDLEHGCLGLEYIGLS